MAQEDQGAPKDQPGDEDGDDHQDPEDSPDDEVPGDQPREWWRDEAAFCRACPTLVPTGLTTSTCSRCGQPVDKRSGLSHACTIRARDALVAAVAAVRLGDPLRSHRPSTFSCDQVEHYEEGAAYSDDSDDDGAAGGVPRAPGTPRVYGGVGAILEAIDEGRERAGDETPGTREGPGATDSDPAPRDGGTGDKGTGAQAEPPVQPKTTGAGGATSAGTAGQPEASGGDAGPPPAPATDEQEPEGEGGRAATSPAHSDDERPEDQEVGPGEELGDPVGADWDDPADQEPAPELEDVVFGPDYEERLALPEDTALLSQENSDASRDGSEASGERTREALLRNNADAEVEEPHFATSSPNAGEIIRDKCDGSEAKCAPSEHAYGWCPLRRWHQGNNRGDLGDPNDSFEEYRQKLLDSWLPKPAPSSDGEGGGQQHSDEQAGGSSSSSLESVGRAPAPSDGEDTLSEVTRHVMPVLATTDQVPRVGMEFGRVGTPQPPATTTGPARFTTGSSAPRAPSTVVSGRGRGTERAHYLTRSGESGPYEGQRRVRLAVMLCSLKTIKTAGTAVGAPEDYPRPRPLRGPRNC